jgi:hypothetical protein
MGDGGGPARYTLLVPGIDWAYLGSIGGEGIEDFVATCLRQRFPDARQTRPASGDQGIDVVRETPDGIVVWQVKRFTAPLTPQQKQNVQRSWNRFWITKVEPGVPIAAYHLATPWTPTERLHDWFRNELCAKATFPIAWEGQAFFNGLAAEYPATADRFFKGPDMLENMVNAKAMLAASPVESADELSMIDAVAARDAALRDIRDQISDNYYLDTSTRSGVSDIPLPVPGDPGVAYRYTSLGSNRWYVETVVPKNVQSTEIDPISIQVQFVVEPSSEEQRKLEDWRIWGIPFRDVEAVVESQGGPLQVRTPRSGRVSFRRAGQTADYPDLALTTTSPSGEDKGQIVLTATDVSKGFVGGGTRVRGISRAGVVEVDLRVGSELSHDHAEIRLLETAGLLPDSVLHEVDILVDIAEDDTFQIAVAGGPDILTGTALRPPPLAAFIRTVAADLAGLQPHTSDELVMPDVRGITESQLGRLHQLAQIYAGQALQMTWDSLVFTVNDPSGLHEVPLDGTGALVVTEQPVFVVGPRQFQITQRLATQYLTPTIPTGVDRTQWNPGDEVELVPGEDNRLIIAAVVDDLPPTQP